MGKVNQLIFLPVFCYGFVSCTGYDRKVARGCTYALATASS
jgi:hypothetical protein